MSRTEKGERPQKGDDISSECDVGAALRALRLRQRQSLKQVAKRAGLSVGLVSQIERGLTSPSLRSLRSLAKVLETPVANLFVQQTTDIRDAPANVVRCANRRVLKLSHRGMTIQLTSPQGENHLQTFIAHIEPGGGSGADLDVHEGEEAGLVLVGALELQLENEVVRLWEGDSFVFDSRRPHRYRNPGDRTASVQWVITPPIY